jgi:hypothetical protein
LAAGKLISDSKVKLFLKILPLIIILSMQIPLVAAQRLRLAFTFIQIPDGLSLDLVFKISQAVQELIEKDERYDLVSEAQIDLERKKTILRQKVRETNCLSIVCLNELANALHTRRMLLGSLRKDSNIIELEISLYDNDIQKLERVKKLFIKENEDFSQLAKNILGSLESPVTEISKSPGFKYNMEDIQKMREANLGKNPRYKKYRPRDEHPDFRSPSLAGFSSFLPIWSGSWNIGFNKWGLLLASTKSAAFGLYISFDNPVQFTAGTVWALITVFDMIFSVQMVNDYNQNLPMTFSGRLFSESRIALSIQPRKNWPLVSSMARKKDFAPDGMELFLIYLY